MSDLDVSLRLRLDSDLDKEGERSERALKDIARAAKDLDGARIGRFDRELKDIERASDRAEKNLKDVKRAGDALGAVRTDRAERELRDMGRQADIVERKLHEARQAAGRLDQRLARTGRRGMTGLDGRLGHSHRQLDRLDQRLGAYGRVGTPTRALDMAMGGLAASAGSAFAAIGAFVTVDNIVRGLNQVAAATRDLDEQMANLANTAETRTEAAIERSIEKVNELAVRYGLFTNQVTDTQAAFTAADITGERQDRVMDPNLRAARATGTPGPVIASATIAALRNLGISEDEIPAFLDQLIFAGKKGSFEVEAVARYAPQLFAGYARSGRTGLDASAEVLGMAQIVREATGTEEEAARFLQNLFDKVFAPDAVKNFGEAGIDLQAIKKRAQEAGTSYVIAVIDEVLKLSGSDPDSFLVGELIPDRQARGALEALSVRREALDKMIDEIVNQSAGTVDEDYRFIRDRPKARADRRAAALSETGRQAGEAYSRFYDPLADAATRFLNPRFRAQERAIDEENRLRGLDTEAMRFELERYRQELATRRETPWADPGRTLIEDKIRQLEADLRAAEALQPGDQSIGVPRPADTPLRVPTTDVPLPPRRPDLEGALDADLTVPGRQSMNGYNEAIEQGSQQALSTIKTYVDRMVATASFTATPTISPRFVTPAAPAVPASAPPAAAAPATVTQNINGAGDPVKVARAVKREQNRSIRLARARALHDTGRPV